MRKRRGIAALSSLGASSASVAGSLKVTVVSGVVLIDQGVALKHATESADHLSDSGLRLKLLAVEIPPACPMM